MWAVLATALLVSAYLLPFRVWAWCVAIGFGIPEAIGVWSKGDRLPPLTFVTSWYLPRWLTATLIGFCSASVAATWAGYAHPWRAGAVGALICWALDHFTVTYTTKG